MDLAKEELIAMQKIKKQNGTVQFELSQEAKSKDTHDDRSDCIAMILDRLMELRAEEALQTTKKEEDFSKVYGRGRVGKKNKNPFSGGVNPFLRRNGGRFA